MLLHHIFLCFHCICCHVSVHKVSALVTKQPFQDIEHSPQDLEHKVTTRGSTYHDDDYEANKQEHKHHGIDDGQPVDLVREIIKILPIYNLRK